MIENMRSSMSRKLPLVTVCKPHNLMMSIAGGGPSLEDTAKHLDGYVAAVNGSLRFLLSKPMPLPYLCGVMDPGEHISDAIDADENVRYYVASICHPRIFDKLKGCDVRLWHATPASIGDEDGVRNTLSGSGAGWLAIGGGCTMGLRWLNLGYILGFRSFDLHGLDSSFRSGRTHAYPDRADSKDHITIDGRETRLNFLAQVRDFFAVMEMFKSLDKINVRVFGDGLLQDVVRSKNADLLCEAGK